MKDFLNWVRETSKDARDGDMEAGIGLLFLTILIPLLLVGKVIAIVFGNIYYALLGESN